VIPFRIPHLRKRITAVPAGVGKNNFRAARILIKSVGFFSHAFAEFGLSASSGGANLLLNGVASSSLSLTAGSLAGGVDGNTTTFWAGGATGSQNQGNGSYTVDKGVGASLSANYLSIRGRDGGGGAEKQAPTLFDLYFSLDGVTFTLYASNLTFPAFAPTTPGHLQELLLP
jgi:hypothetical protein